MYDRQLEHMNSVSASGELRANIAAAGGVPNRQPHGPITKAAPDRVYSTMADIAGFGANLTGDITDLTLGALVNAVQNKFSPGSGNLQLNPEPYYGYDGPATLPGQIRDLPNALHTAGIDLYNHPIGTLLEQGQYIDPNLTIYAPEVLEDTTAAYQLRRLSKGDEGTGATRVGGSQPGTIPTGAGKGPVQENEVTTYGDFKDRSVPGDGIGGHELWQHANLKAHGLATKRLSTPASRENSVIGLKDETHTQVTAAQGGLDAANQTPIENINANAAILRYQKVADEKTIAELHRRAIEHANKHGHYK